MADEQVELEVLPEVKKKRGRPRKVKTEEETELKEEVPSEEKVEEEPVPEVKKKRGRPRKVKVEE